MSCEVWALYLTVALALVKAIYYLAASTFNSLEFLFDSIVLALFLCCLGSVCDVFTSKGSVRWWNKRAKVFYIRRDEQPIGYVLLLSLWIFSTVSIGILALTSQ